MRDVPLSESPAGGPSNQSVTLRRVGWRFVILYALAYMSICLLFLAPALVGGRVTYDITNRWSLGGIVSVLQGSGGARQYAYGLEVGYIVVDNLYLTMGYNWRGFSDKDLTGSDYTNRGWVLGMRYKFDEDLFKKSDASVNKTLNPNAAPAKP